MPLIIKGCHRNYMLYDTFAKGLFYIYSRTTSSLLDATYTFVERDLQEIYKALTLGSKSQFHSLKSIATSLFLYMPIPKGNYSYNKVSATILKDSDFNPLNMVY